MVKSFLISFCGLIVGVALGYLFILKPIVIPFLFQEDSQSFISEKPTQQVIGFLPYWLVSKAQKDYSSFITQLAYFSLTPDEDGHIKKLETPVEEEPGWYTLRSGKMESFFSEAKKRNVELSLVIFSGDRELIDTMMKKPLESADNMMNDVLPLMKRYGFTNLNLDIERVSLASPSAQTAFTRFTAQVKHRLNQAQTGTLTVDITGADLIKQTLVSPKDIGKIADYVMIMTYDFHYAGSSVTGPVAPVGGATTLAEYDVVSAIQKAREVIPEEKIIVGAPLYGYQWEALRDTPRSATLPGSGITASHQRVTQLLSTCATCSAVIDEDAKESYLIYKDQETGTFHHIFYPTEQSTQAKIDLVEEYNLAGIGLWALGYESREILRPLEMYKNE